MGGTGGASTGVDGLRGEGGVSDRRDEREKPRARVMNEKADPDRGRGGGGGEDGRDGIDGDLIEAGAVTDRRFLSMPSDGDSGAAGSSSLPFLDDLRNRVLLLDLTDLDEGAGLGARLPVRGRADVERESRFVIDEPIPLPRLACFASACVRPVTGGCDLPDILRRKPDEGRKDERELDVGSEGGTAGASSDARGEGGNGTTPSHSLSSSTTCPFSPFRGETVTVEAGRGGFVTERCRVDGLVVPRLPPSSPDSRANASDVIGRVERDRVSTVRFESGYELPPDEVEKMDGASKGRSLVPSLLRPSDDAVSDSCAPTAVEAGRFLTSLRFLLADASAPFPSYCREEASRRRANADAVEANET